MTAIQTAPLSSVGKRFGAFALEILLACVTLGIGWFIWSLVLWGKGQSPAKSLLKMRVIRKNTGKAASWGEMALRELVGKWLLGSVSGSITYLVGGIMILGATREGLWDKIAGTIVVEDPDGHLAP